MTWVAVAHVDEIAPLSGRCVKTAGDDIGVFKTAEGDVFAIVNRCPHRGGPLTEGIVHGTSVTCPLHNMVISLRTGEIEGPEEGGVGTVPVEIRGGIIHLDVAPDALQARRANQAA